MNRYGTALGLAAMLAVANVRAAESTPAARIVDVKGTATIVDREDLDRRAAVYGTIYGGERIVVGENSQVMMVFRTEGQVERIVAPGTFQIAQNGCQPRKGVERVPLPERHRATIGKISQGPRGIVQGGVVVARSVAPSSDDPEPPPMESESLDIDFGAMTPVFDSTVLEPQPEFSWPAVRHARQYSLTLESAGKRIWSANTGATNVKYAGHTPLKLGATYTWEVTVSLDDRQAKFCAGQFRTASSEQCATIEALKKMLADSNPTCLALAAMWYRHNGLLHEAIDANERLAAITADPAIWQELIDLYYETNNEKRALAAEQRMNALQQSLP